MGAASTRGPISPAKKKEQSSKPIFRWKTANKDWHPDIIFLYNSLRSSSNFDQFEATDNAVAWNVCSELSDYKDNPEKNASHYKNLMALFMEFAPTLASRRRLSLEVEKIQEEKKTAEILQGMAASILHGQKGGV